MLPSVVSLNLNAIEVAASFICLSQSSWSIRCEHIPLIAMDFRRSHVSRLQLDGTASPFVVKTAAGRAGPLRKFLEQTQRICSVMMRG